MSSLAYRLARTFGIVTNRQLTDLAQRGDEAQYPCVLRRARPRVGRTQTHGHRRRRRRGQAGAPRYRAGRHQHQGRDHAVRPGRLPGRLRRAPGGEQPDRSASQRGGAEPRLREVRGGRAPHQHREAGIREQATRRPARRRTRPRHRTGFAVAPAGHRGLPTSGDGGVVPARPHLEVQGETGSHLRPAALRAVAVDGPHRIVGAGDACAPGRRPRGLGGTSARGSRPPNARASCVASRIRSTR